MPGANYTVTIDGITRVNHDVRETAIEMGRSTTALSWRILSSRRQARLSRGASIDQSARWSISG